MRGSGFIISPIVRSLLIGICAACAVVLVTWPLASQALGGRVAPSGATGVLHFDLSYELEDEATWALDKRDRCAHWTGSGRHRITGEVGGFQVNVPVRWFGEGKPKVIPWPDGTWSPMGGVGMGTGNARYANRSVDTNKLINRGPQCVLQGDDNKSDWTPPKRKCGVKKGTVRLMTFDRSEDAGREAVFTIEDSWSPDDPFGNDSERPGHPYCYDSTFWHWSPGFPGFEDADEEPRVVVKTSELLKFFERLTRRQRAACSSVSSERFCRRADYVRETKVIQRRNDPAPQKHVIRQTSIARLEFRLNGYTLVPRPRG